MRKFSGKKGMHSNNRKSLLNVSCIYYAKSDWLITRQMRIKNLIFLKYCTPKSTVIKQNLPYPENLRINPKGSKRGQGVTKATIIQYKILKGQQVYILSNRIFKGKDQIAKFNTFKSLCSIPLKRIRISYKKKRKNKLEAEQAQSHYYKALQKKKNREFHLKRSKRKKR